MSQMSMKQRGEDHMAAGHVQLPLRVLFEALYAVQDCLLLTQAVNTKCMPPAAFLLLLVAYVCVSTIGDTLGL